MILENKIREIFENVKTIAIIGLSPNEQKPSFKVASYLQKQGFKIVPIYPKEKSILNEKVYRSLSEVPFKIDMVDMFRKAEFADTLVDEIKQRDDIKVLWLQKGIINDQACKRAEEFGLEVIQDRCTMIEHKGLHTTW